MSAHGLSSPVESWYQWHSATGDEQAVFWLCAGLSLFMLASGIHLVCAEAAPYGRYNEAPGAASSSSSSSQRSLYRRILTACGIDPRWAFFLFESPNLIAAVLCWYNGNEACKASWGNRVVLLCFVCHYVNRTLIYPSRMKGGKPMPLVVLLSAVLFCSANGYAQCRSLTRLLLVPTSSWGLPLGLLLWMLGFCINLDADDRLRNLRKPGETGYKIPKGGMFRFVSGANYFGEILEWLGYAIAMGGALPGVTFAFCTACNIGPRALSHHSWYLQKFKDSYPKDRKALIPFLL